MITDPIADMLTKMRNALNVKHKSVEVAHSNEKEAIVKILLEEGYILSYEVVANENIKTMQVELKYLAGGESVIAGLKRISKPGLRVYATKDKLPKVISGLGIAIISTNKGILTDKHARELAVGGEVLAYVW